MKKSDFNLKLTNIVESIQNINMPTETKIYFSDIYRMYNTFYEIGMTSISTKKNISDGEFLGDNFIVIDDKKIKLTEEAWKQIHTKFLQLDYRFDKHSELMAGQELNKFKSYKKRKKENTFKSILEKVIHMFTSKKIDIIKNYVKDKKLNEIFYIKKEEKNNINYDKRDYMLEISYVNIISDILQMYQKTNKNITEIINIINTIFVISIEKHQHINEKIENKNTIPLTSLCDKIGEAILNLLSEIITNTEVFAFNWKQKDFENFVTYIVKSDFIKTTNKKPNKKDEKFLKKFLMSNYKNEIFPINKETYNVISQKIICEIHDKIEREIINKSYKIPKIYKNNPK